MASDGDVKTYGYTGSKVTEDVSDINEIYIHYCYGGQGQDSNDTFGGEGGKVDGVTVDVSNQSQLQLWVAQKGNTFGRYSGGSGGSSTAAGAGSTEVAFGDGTTVVGAGGGGGGGESRNGGSGGARGGDGSNDGGGTPPPQGGDGGDGGSMYGDGYSGEGYINTNVASGGTTDYGNTGDGEIKIEYFGGFDITIDGQEVTGITVDGQEVTGVTIDGTSL